MTLERLKQTVGPLAWQAFNRVLGEPEAMQQLREELRRKLDAQRQAEQAWQADRAKLEQELDLTRNERLSWQGKEASTRKELQDCQERSKDLLEQVVRLTHQQREAKKNLLDEQFRTSTTPLERNRFEMDLTEARGDVRRAEEKVKQAESKLAECQRARKELQAQVGRIKDLENELQWARQRAEDHLQALRGAILRIQQLERLIKRPYRRPDMRRASPEQVAAFERA